MTCHHIPSVRCPECMDNRPSMGYWPTPTSYCTGCTTLQARLAEAIRFLEDGHCTYAAQGPECPSDHVTAECDVCRTVKAWKGVTSSKSKDSL